jgi:predicted DCC family thiol-disulfide oxidoreductase YuxK
MMISKRLPILLTSLMVTSRWTFTTAFSPQSTRLHHTRSLHSSAAIEQQQEPKKLLDPKSVSVRVFEADQRPIILFDGVCNLCNNAVNLALDWDPKGKLRFSALQSNVGRALLEANGRKADDISSIVLVTSDGAYIKSDAVLKITEALTPQSVVLLKPLAILGQYLIPKFLRDIIYDGVANNRYRLMGTQDQCRFDADGEFEDRFVDDSLALKQ